MIGIVRIYHDSYGANMGSRTFCQLSEYFGGVLITDNKKIIALDKYKTLSHSEALLNIKKFTKIIVYNSKPNMFGGKAPKFAADVVRLILAVPNLYFYNCDPILDLQLGVPASHERAVPGLSRAIRRLNEFGVKLSRKNTDLTKFLAANIEREPVAIPGPKKEYLGCYFGNSRGKERQEQVKNLLVGLDSQLIIGHEHELFPWFDYTPNFFGTLSLAWTTPVIGDKKLHYETGIPSVRLYEIWHTTTIGLLDSRFNEPLLDERFYFTSPEDYQKKTVEIANDPELYNSMLKVQRIALRKLKKRYAGIKFDWKAVRRAKEKKEKLEKKQVKLEKEKVIEKSKAKLLKRGIKL